MKINKKKNIIIAVLCSFMVLMGLGYALLAQTLTINATASVSGSFDVQITNVEATTVHGYAEDTSNDLTKIASDGHSATISANLGAPGDYIVYTVTVSNLGTIAAKYDMATQNLITSPTGQATNIIEATTDVDKVDSLKYLAPTTGVGTFTVTLTFKESVVTIPDDKNYQFTISPNFIQTAKLDEPNNNNSPEPASSFTPEAQFTVANDGTLVKYKLSSGTNVAVPASFGGKNITKIGREAFRDYNVGLIYVSENLYDIVIFADTEYEYNQIKTTAENSAYSAMINEIYDASANVATEFVGFFKVNGSSMTLMTYDDIENMSSTITSLDLTNATNLVEISDVTFRNITTLTSVNLGSTVTTIGSYAFYNTMIQSIVLPSSLIEMSTYTFGNCPNLTTVTILGDSTRFDSDWNVIFHKTKSEFTVN